ncbi:ArnT family glycosyltransferase [Desulfonema magnum]|uniref:Glycosyltransferase domain-containing protein n=1 Tax=Desulfonema magnum TaxID=45655 RepID=A0A975BWA5_9BACT|nr:glycosyltransferase family 39 protein [Desulfonema magnum]QTA92394.1 Glycosyltransferase domain-containing protein [Desulfonema magnum]
MTDIICLSGICVLVVGMGRFILDRIGIRSVSLGQDVIISAGTGLGVLSYSVFILGIFQCLFPVVLYILLGIYAAFSLSGWLILRRSWLNLRTLNKKDNRLSFSDICISVILGISLLGALLFVLTPAIGNDALTYHLAVPKLFLEHHGFFFIPGNIFSHYPLNSEMLFLIALVLRGDILAKGIHFAMAMFTLGALWQFTRDYISETASFPLILLIFFTIPSVFMNAHMAYNDMTLTFYTFLAVYTFMNWFSQKGSRWIILCGLFSGLAMATKYAALLVPLLGCLGILCAFHRETHYRKMFYVLGIYALCVAVFGSPFYIKNWVMSGNPLYPFFYKIFGGKGWSTDQARYYDFFLQNLGMGRGLWDYVLLPWNLSFHAKMHSPQFDGIMGPVFILTLPFALGMRKIATGAKVGMIYCLFTFIFWASSAQQIRYLIPIFPFLAVMTGYTLDYYRKNRIVHTLLAMFITLSLVFNGYYIVKDFIKIRPFSFVAGTEDRDAYLNRLIPSYAMFRYVNTRLPKDTKIFFIYMKNQGYLCDRPYYSDSMFESYTIQNILAKSATPKDVYLALKKTGFTHMLYDINYITGKISTFSDQEKSLFLDFQKRYLKLLKIEKRKYYLFALP